VRLEGNLIIIIIIIITDSTGRCPGGLRCRSLVARFRVCGFISSPEHGYLSLVSVVCCQVEVSATGLSLVQRSPSL